MHLGRRSAVALKSAFTVFLVPFQRFESSQHCCQMTDCKDCLGKTFKNKKVTSAGSDILKNISRHHSFHKISAHHISTKSPKLKAKNRSFRKYKMTLMRVFLLLPFRVGWHRFSVPSKTGTQIICFLICRLYGYGYSDLITKST